MGECAMSDTRHEQARTPGPEKRPLKGRTENDRAAEPDEDQRETADDSTTGSEGGGPAIGVGRSDDTKKR
jgi:hypothetical protein